jgi:hypothetical protein
MGFSELPASKFLPAWEAASTGLNAATSRITKTSAQALDGNVFGTGIFDAADHLIQDYVYLWPLEYLTNQQQENAVVLAQSHVFTFEKFEVALSDVTLLQNNMVTVNQVAKDAGNFVNTTREYAVFTTMIAALVLIAAGIAGAVFSGGVSLLAVIVGISTLVITYASAVSTISAIGEAVGAAVHVDAIVPYVFVNPSVDEAFLGGASASNIQSIQKPATTDLLYNRRNQGNAGDHQGRQTHSESVFDYYQKLLEMVESGDSTWATTGIDSLNYYEDLARHDEDLVIVDFLASSDSALKVIDNYGALVNDYIVKTAARELFSASLELNSFVYREGYTDSSVITNVLTALDSTIVNYTKMETTRLSVYDSLGSYNIPTQTAVGIGDIDFQPVASAPSRVSLQVEVINYGTDLAQGVQVFPSLSSEGVSLLGDTLTVIDIPGGDTTFVEFQSTGSDSFLDGVVFLHADSTVSNYYTMPGKDFSFELLAESPPTEGTLSNDNIFAFPNPFNPDSEAITFRFRLARAGNVTIKVYDVSNTLVKTVISNSPIEAGVESGVTWDGKNENGVTVANGVYFYVIESSSGEKGVGKVAVLR